MLRTALGVIARQQGRGLPWTDVADRVRVVDQGVAATVVARAPDGEHLTTVATLDKDRFGAMSLERPALVRTETGR